MYIVKSRYYAEADSFGESYVITSNNEELDTNFNNGDKVLIVRDSIVHRKPFTWMKEWLDAYFYCNTEAKSTSEIIDWINQQPMQSC